MIKTEHKYSDLTAKIIGAAMRVHADLVNGFQKLTKIFHKRIHNVNGLRFRIVYLLEITLIKF